jgi:cytochrome c-type biogenesis protein
MAIDLYISIGVMLAGLVSFLSPCVLPLVPPYLAYLGGTSLDRLAADGGGREVVEEGDDAVAHRVLIAALFFVLGFTTVFVALGAAASMLGQVIQSYRGPLSIAAGVVIILFGLHFLGLLKLPMLYVEKRWRADVTRATNGGAYLMGLAFAFGWTPCIGPVLTAVLSLAAQETSLGAGVWLLLLYSLGLGIPFVAAAFAVKPFLAFMGRFRRHLGTVEKLMGAALVLTGILFLTGSINWFGQWMLDSFPALARIEEWIAGTGLGGEILRRGGGG